MENKFSLSDKIWLAGGYFNRSSYNMIAVNDLKEFIRLLKKGINKNQNITQRQKINIAKDIKELAGDKLI